MFRTAIKNALQSFEKGLLLSQKSPGFVYAVSGTRSFHLPGSSLAPRGGQDIAHEERPRILITGMKNVSLPIMD